MSSFLSVASEHRRWPLASVLIEASYLGYLLGWESIATPWNHEPGTILDAIRGSSPVLKKWPRRVYHYKRQKSPVSSSPLKPTSFSRTSNESGRGGSSFWAPHSLQGRVSLRAEQIETQTRPAPEPSKTPKRIKRSLGTMKKEMRNLERFQQESGKNQPANPCNDQPCRVQSGRVQKRSSKKNLPRSGQEQAPKTFTFAYAVLVGRLSWHRHDETLRVFLCSSSRVTEILLLHLLQRDLVQFVYNPLN